MDVCIVCNRQQIVFTNEYGVSYCKRHVPFERKCKFCKQTFYTHTKNQIFCKNEACIESRSTKKEKAKPLIKLTCSICKKDFETRIPHQKYCSSECSIKSSYLASNRGRFIIFERDGFRCAYCGRTSYSDEHELHVDHVVPRFYGGESVASNLITACTDCNLGKGSTLLSLENRDAILQEIKRRNTACGIPSDKIIKLASEDQEDAN